MTLLVFDFRVGNSAGPKSFIHIISVVFTDFRRSLNYTKRKSYRNAYKKKKK